MMANSMDVQSEATWGAVSAGGMDGPSAHRCVLQLCASWNKDLRPAGSFPFHRAHGPLYAQVASHYLEAHCVEVALWNVARAKRPYCRARAHMKGVQIVFLDSFWIVQ